MRLLAVAAAALALAPAAAAWTTVGAGVQNIVVPSMLVTQAGTLLVSWESPNGNTISVSRAHEPAQVVVSNDPIAGQTQLVQQPSGAIQIYFPNLAGVARLTSTDDGQTWSGPVQTQSHQSSGVTGAAVAPDGTPYFVQRGTGYVDVFRGLNGESSRNIFTRCCGYAASVAVDTNGVVQVAFYSNADPDGAFVYDELAPDLSVASSVPLKPTAPHDDRVPLVSDHSGHTFMTWPPGYPDATALKLVPFAGGQPAGDGVSFPGTFAGGDPHAALTVDAQDRVWSVWTASGHVYAARSRSHGRDFGATVSVTVPGTSYQISAAGLATTAPGSVDVIVNTGASLVEQALEPGLSVRLSKTTKKVGKKRIVTHFAQALDDGFGVAGATFTIHGHTYHGNAAGKAKVPAGKGKAAAPGYVGASFAVH